MTSREIKGQFAGSFGGILWSVAHPLIMFCVYLVVFVKIFKMRAPEYAGQAGFAFYLMSGLFPWMAFVEGLQRATSSVIQNGNLIKKSVFPVEILPAKSILSAFVASGIALVVLGGYVAVSLGNVSALALLPLAALVQIVFTLGLGFLFASIAPYFRDVVQMVQVAVNFWFYLTPILYPLSLLPEWGRTLMWCNPFYPFVRVYHDIVILGSIADTGAALAAIGWALGSYCAGAYIFARLKYDFADWV